ncbi:hypothetical protein G7054_g8881 [Neopestalotiopsis clavispora]|nr:hypothetical protein G7054_g8881 [Neopestalotiopsis clavispora]
METTDGYELLKTLDSLNSLTSVDENVAEYLSLIQDQVQPFFPDFAVSLSRQSPLEQEYGRCAVVDLSHASDERRTLFQNSDELGQYLSGSPASPGADSGDEPRRRLFILEDLSRNYISILGSHLRIPPSFFAGHYDDPSSAQFNHRRPFERHSASQFNLRYIDSHRVEIDVSPHEASGIYACNTNSSRYLYAYDPSGPLYDEAIAHHVLSFWSTPIGTDGSWDAVLLVDPPLGSQVKLLASGQLVPIRHELKDESSMRKRYLYPELHSLRRLPEDISAWAASQQRPQFTSMFDDVLNDITSSRNRSARELDDPRTAVEFPRKMAIGIMLSFLRRRYLNLLHLHNTQVKQNLTHRTLRCKAAHFSDGAFSKWNDHYFDFIISSRAAMKELIRELGDNLISTGITMQHGITQGSEGASGAAPVPQWEIDGWLSVMELAHAVDDLLKSTATGYMQYITIQEARLSGANAQSLSKITVATMLFIPMSTIAGIFSMSDDYLPGKPRAWIFWVVSFPLLLSLAYLHWRQQLLELLVKKKLHLSQFIGKVRKPNENSYV